jgi:hypothetical protein
MNKILDLISAAWEHLKNFYRATSKASEAFLSKSLLTENTDWATLLTDIITVSAALGALALPLSLSVIEATRSRYKSPSLLSIYTEVSRTNPQKINRSLFGILAFTLFLKLTLLANIVDFVYLIPLIIGLAVFFSAAILDLYKHLRFTYRLMSNVNLIRDDLLVRLDKSIPYVQVKSEAGEKKTRKKRKLEKYSSQVVAALIELETYDICSMPSKRDIEEKLKRILYIQSSNLSEPRSEEFMQDVLGAFPRMMAEVETSRELDIYQTISGLYLHLLAKAVIASSDFSHHLDEAIRISRFREQSLPPYGQFCRNGRIFLSCTLKKPSRDTYAVLFEHFKKLLWNALHTNPENIPDILSNADSLLFGTGYNEDPSYVLHYSIDGLWEYKKSRDITKTIKACLDKKITTEQLERSLLDDVKPGIIEFVKQKKPSADAEKVEQTFRNAVDEVVTSIASREISAAIEIETLQTLGLLLEKNPDLIIKCRESKNPAGASGFNMGRPIVPSSLNACINALVYERNFTRNLSIEEVLEFKVVDAIGVLIVYELWKDFVFSAPARTIDEYVGALAIPNCTIRELKSARDRIEVLEKSFKKILSNKKIAEKLSLLEAQKNVLSSLASKLCETLREKLSGAARSKINNDPLDSEALDRFRAELVEDWSASPALFLLRRVRLAECRSFTFTMERARESFLADTGTHYVFNGIGRHLLDRYAGGLVLGLLQKKGQAPSVAYPSPFGVIILLTHDSLMELTGSAYTYDDGILIWPCQMYQMPMYVINSTGSLYYQIYKEQKIFDVDYSNNTNGYPITIAHKDDKSDEIETSIRFNFSLSKTLDEEI